MTKISGEVCEILGMENMSTTKRRRVDAPKVPKDGMHAITALEGIMKHIASFLPTYDSLALFLEAFESNQGLQSMQVFRHLPDDMKNYDVWPYLWVDNFKHLEILKQLAVHVREIDVTWKLKRIHLLKKVISESNVVHIFNVEKGVARPDAGWYTRLVKAKIPVTALTLSDKKYDIGQVIGILDRLPDLRLITFECTEIPRQEELFGYVARSQLESFNLQCPFGEDVDLILTNENVRHLCEWIEREAVRELSLTVQFAEVDEAVMLRFYQATFTCTSMKKLILPKNMPFFQKYAWKIPMQMESLRIRGEVLDDTSAEIYARGLVDSSVKRVWLLAENVGPVGVSAIMSALPHTNVRDLSIMEYKGCDESTHAIAGNIHRTKIKYLKISPRTISYECAKLFIQGLAKSSVQRLEIWRGVDDGFARALAEGLSSTRINHLTIAFAPATDVCAFHLAEAFTNTPSLTTLVFERVNFSSLAYGFLVQALMSKAAPSHLNILPDAKHPDYDKLKEFVEIAAAKGHVLDVQGRVGHW